MKFTWYIVISYYYLWITVWLNFNVYRASQECLCDVRVLTYGSCCHIFSRNQCGIVCTDWGQIVPHNWSLSQTFTTNANKLLMIYHLHKVLENWQISNGICTAIIGPLFGAYTASMGHSITSNRPLTLRNEPFFCSFSINRLLTGTPKVVTSRLPASY